MAKNLLLLSSSRVGDTGFLEHALPLIKQFLSDTLASATKIQPANNVEKPIKLLFIPYAGISIGFNEYSKRLSDAVKNIAIEIESIHTINDKLKAIQHCQGIIIGGGNTFSLLNSLYQHKLIEPIRHRIEQGIPYIGWSAGSNIAAPTITTTNDMPIVEPPSFKALNLLPWQINPHYIEGSPPGHNGETRQQRLEEFLIVNPDKKVIGIPEGTALSYRNGRLSYIGQPDGYLFSKSGKTAFDSTSDLNQLLD